MTKKQARLRTMVVVLALAMAVALQHFITNSVHRAPALPVAGAASIQIRVALPARLVIPKIGVDAPVEQVGLTSTGSMGISASLTDVAWYEYGQRPGEIGSAVIAGHYGGSSLVAVFNNLHELKPGDRLSILSAAGTSTTFVVRSSRDYDANADATTVFRSNDGQAHLNLITCEGAWNRATKSYTQRLVVFTDKL